jgi:alpha-mannosidase/mannosylglycerate hydrolase
VELRRSSHAWKEADPVERPHNTLFGIESEHGGLAILCPEWLHEHSVYDDPQRTMAMTLYRSFERTVGTDGQPGGQLLGRLDFEYALMPYAGQLDRAEMMRRLMELQAPVYSHCAAAPVGSQAIVQLSGASAIVPTAIKPAADGGGVVVRLWNTGPREEGTDVHFNGDVGKAQLCNLDEAPTDELTPAGGTVHVTVPGRGLATVKVRTVS